MKKVYALAAVSLFLIVFSAGCRLFSDNRAAAQKISGEIEIGSQWKEIVPDAALQSNEEIQFVGLKMENIKGRSETDRRKLFRTGGDELEIEVELVDAAGNPIRLFPIGIGQFVEFGTGNPLPRDASYEKIRIRSSERILVKEIIWGDSSSW